MKSNNSDFGDDFICSELLTTPLLTTDFLTKQMIIKSRKNDRHFADDIFKLISFENEFSFRFWDWQRKSNWEKVRKFGSHYMSIP